MQSSSRICAFVLMLSAGAMCQSVLGAEPPPMPTSGIDVPEMASFDRIISEMMRKYEIPGGAVAVTKDGRLLLARGYGLADVQRKEAVKPDSLMRIASVSKPITAAAVLVLLQQGRLTLDAKVVDLLGPIKLPDDRKPEPSRIRLFT